VSHGYTVCILYQRGEATIRNRNRCRAGDAAVREAALYLGAGWRASEQDCPPFWCLLGPTTSPACRSLSVQCHARQGGAASGEGGGVRRALTSLGRLGLGRELTDQTGHQGLELPAATAASASAATAATAAASASASPSQH